MINIPCAMCAILVALASASTENADSSTAENRPKSSGRAEENQSKNSQGVSSPSKESPMPARAEWFDEALKLHYEKEYRDAAAQFYAFLNGSPRTADNYEWAQFFLGEDLASLGFSHAAVVYWANVAKTRARAEVFPEALASLEKLTSKTPYDKELIEREVLYNTDFGPVSTAISDYIQFYKGLIALKDGDLRWSKAHFKKLHSNSVYYARAKLIQAVEKMTRGKDVEGALADFEALAGDKQAPREVRNEARIAAARLYFERSEFDKTHLLYDGVELPELDPGRGQIYLEKAWTYYRKGDASQAMGLLLALDAPSFRDLFLPEKYILQSLIYKDRCHYLPAKRAARGFLRRYKSALVLIHERGNLKDDSRLIRAALEQSSSLKEAGEFLEQLGKERDKVDQYASRFEASGLTRHLRGLYDRAIAEATRQRESTLRRALVDTADRLLRDEEQVRLLEYEIGLDLYKRVRKGGANTIAKAKDPEVQPDDVLYLFDGEYWNDELKDYRLFLPSRCAAVEADK